MGADKKDDGMIAAEDTNRVGNGDGISIVDVVVVDKSGGGKTRTPQVGQDGGAVRLKRLSKHGRQ